MTAPLIIAESMNDEESTDHVDADSVDANSVDPINTINGNVTVNDTDLVIPAAGIPLVLSRAYDSRSIYTNSPVGACWSHSYDWHLFDMPNHVYRGVSNDWKVLRTGSGDLHWFETQTGGTFKSPAGVDLRLTDETTHFDLLADGQLTFTFSTNGLLQSMTDPHGNALSFAYTTSGNKQVVSSVAHSSGPSLAFTYTNGLLTRVNSPTNSLYVTYSYNGEELTGATRHASGETFATTYGYGDVHSLTQRVNAAGDTFAFGYEIVTNASGVVIAKGTSMALGDEDWYAHSVAYNTASNRSTLTYQRDGTNQVYDYRYDPDTLAISAVYGPNSTNLVTRYTRDAAHNVTRIKVANETTGEYLLTSISYDARHNLASSAVGYNSLPLHTWNYVWNLTNNTLLSTSDPLGHETTFDYDGTLPVAVHEYPASNVTLTTRFAYTPSGQLAAVTNANGHWTRFEYGGHGFVTSSVPQAGPTVSYAYNALGHLKSITLPGAAGARTTTLVPDDMGRVTSVTYPGGSLSALLAYDKMGNLTNHTDTAGRNTKFTYLPTRKLASVTRGSGAETATVRFDYDQQFNTLTIKDALEREVETYQLDIQDRPITISNLESQTMNVAYGVGDMVKSVTRFDGTTVSNSYDGQARLTGVSWPDASTPFSYYDNALLRTVANESGTISNTYDQANRLTSVSTLCVSAPLREISYSLDGIGNATNVLVSVEGSGILTNAYTFDAAERVSEIEGAGGTFAFTYGPYNGLVAGVSNTTSGIRAEYVFDDLDRPTNIVWRNGTGGILRNGVLTPQTDRVGLLPIVREPCVVQDVSRRCGQ
jgi:YD repeat-containing protein